MIRALLATREPLGVQELADAAELPPHTVRRVLRAVEGAGWPLRSERAPWVSAPGRRGGALKRIYRLEAGDLTEKGG